MDLTVSMSFGKAFQAFQHRATISSQASTTQMARRSARRWAQAFSIGLSSGGMARERRKGDVVGPGECPGATPPGAVEQ